MHTTHLSLKSLHLLSEELGTDFDQHLEACVADCKQRPALAGKREVILKLVITPHPDDLDDVVIAPITTRKTPARKLDTIRARRNVRNQMQFDFNEV